MQFRRVLEALCAFLEERRLRHALAGGLALACYGSTRATTDIDMLIEEAGRHASIEFLQSLGYETLQTYEGFSNHLHPLSAMGRVDLIYLTEPTASLVFSEAHTVTCFSRSIQVPSAEHLVAMKVAALQDNPDRLHKDMVDLEFLLQLPGVKLEKIRYYFSRHGLEDRYEEIIQRFGLR